MRQLYVKMMITRIFGNHHLFAKDFGGDFVNNI